MNAEVIALIKDAGGAAHAVMLDYRDFRWTNTRGVALPRPKGAASIASGWQECAAMILPPGGASEGDVLVVRVPRAGPGGLPDDAPFFGAPPPAPAAPRSRRRRTGRTSTSAPP